MTKAVPAKGGVSVDPKLSPFLLIRRDILAYVGDLPMASFLTQVFYWYTKTRVGNAKLSVHKDGKYWIAKTQSQWCMECGLTAAQYRRIVFQLCAMEVLEQQISRWGTSTITLICLKGFSESAGMVESTIPDVLKQLFQNGGINNTRIAESTKLRSKEITVIDYKKNIKTVADAPYTMPDADEVLKGFQGRAVDPKAHKAKSGSLALLWTKRMATLHPEYAGPLKAKDMGQFKLIAKALGDAAPIMVDWALRHWVRFCIAVQNAKGHTSSPDLPQIGYILANADILRAEFGRVDAPVPGTRVPEKIIPMVVPEPVVDSVQDDLPPMTPEQIAADLAEMKALKANAKWKK